MLVMSWSGFDCVGPVSPRSLPANWMALVPRLEIGPDPISLRSIYCDRLLAFCAEKALLVLDGFCSHWRNVPRPDARSEAFAKNDQISAGFHRPLNECVQLVNRGMTVEKHRSGLDG